MQNLQNSARTITRAIAAAEKANSLALKDAGRLLAAMTDAHLKSGVAIESDHRSFEEVLAGIASQIAARGAYATMHRQQAALARKLGIDITSEGSCPPRPSAELPTPARLPALALVANA